MSVGNIDHQKVMKSMELFGTQVAPVVRKAVAKKNPEEKTAKVAVDNNPVLN